MNGREFNKHNKNVRSQWNGCQAVVMVIEIDN